MIKVEALSSTWINIKAHIATRQATLRARLESPGTTWEETLQLRARLNELNFLITETKQEEPSLVEQTFDLPG